MKGKRMINAGRLPMEGSLLVVGKLAIECNGKQYHSLKTKKTTN